MGLHCQANRISIPIYNLSVPYAEEFSVILFLLLVALCAYLLCAGKLNGQTFAWSILLCAFSVAVIHNLDVIQKLQFKGGHIEATAEFERIRNEVFAKADQVQHMTEAVAGLIAENVATSNRYGGSGDPDPLAQLFRYRQQLRETLTASGTSPDRQAVLLEPFAKWIPFDLKGAISQSIGDIDTKRRLTSAEYNAHQAEISAALNETPPLRGLDDAVKLLQQHDLTSLELTRNLERYRSFLTQDCLP